MKLNRKRTYRVYRDAGFEVRRRKRKRIAGVERQPVAPPKRPQLLLEMDFVSDGLADGRRLRCLNIFDNFTRECWRSRQTLLCLGEEFLR